MHPGSRQRAGGPARQPGYPGSAAWRPGWWPTVWLLVWWLGAGRAAADLPWRTILVPANSHPAVVSAAQLLARGLDLPAAAVVTAGPDARPKPGEVLLTTNLPEGWAAAELGLTSHRFPADGYGIVITNGAVWIYGQRPRSLLFAVGEVDAWRGRTNGALLRHPAFAFRSASVSGRYSVAECVARLGVNVIIGRADAPVTLRTRLPEVYHQLSAADRLDLTGAAEDAAATHQRMAEACHAADVDYYPLLYGNDFARWSPALYAAALRAFPTARGTDAPYSWETASLCPSDPGTWKLVRAYVAEFIERSHADGLYVTFWDEYGLYCQCDRCQRDGLNQFPNELEVCVSNYQAVADSLGCPLVVRTWSSGASHWLGDQWVHAPGNGGPSGEAAQLWGRVIQNLPARLAIQTKVYAADCQPDPPFSALLGHARPHQEIAEYQITGQTTGRLYLPAAAVDYTAWTLRRSLQLTGPGGGVSLFAGATKNPGYSLFGDAVNGINFYAWRQLSWNPAADVEAIWLDWARRFYGERAAPAVVRALRRSESVINRLFSALGLGNDTNSGFAGTIARREVLLKYTNRYFLPEGQAALEPTLANVERVVAEKEDCLRQIAAMQRDIDSVAADLPPERLAELRTRLDWLQQFALVERYLDESLWRYRYLRHRAHLMETDADQMAFLAAAWDQVREHNRRLFKFDPGQHLSCYNVPLGDLRTRPSLGNPLPLMTELYGASLALVQGALGPESVPPQWIRGQARPPAGVAAGAPDDTQ